VSLTSKAVDCAIIGVIAAGMWTHGGKKWLLGSKAPALAFVDTRGRGHSFAAPDKPAVVVLWVSPCEYAARDLGVLDRLRALYAEEDLDVIGLYLNRTDDGEIDHIASVEGHRITMARGQPTGEFVQELTAGLEFRGTGRDIYVIGRDGRFVAVDASDLSTPDDALLEKVRSLLRRKHGLKERDG
jgi:hypothetical protein